MTPIAKCLIVDDLDENLLALAALLDDPDVEVLGARSGAEALELLLAHSFALAFLDVQMPGMDGFELAELMRGSERTRDIPIIFVTAGGGDQPRIFKGYDSGAVDFLHKPIEPHILTSKARVFFQLHRQKLQLAEELRQRTEALRTNELFTAMLGHDLRGPLSAISMAALVLERKADDERLRQMAGRALASAHTMGRMIEDLLDLARVRVAGGMVMHREPGALAQMLAPVIGELRDGHPARSIDWQVSGDGGGEWDPDRLAQVVSNLVRNALRHGAEGGAVEVRLDGSAAGEVVLTVANSGRIDPALLPHIFDPFRSRERMSARREGLGIGLFIVREVVAAHGGTIGVTSGDDDRTLFAVTLPRRAGTSTARQ
ncbi:MAG: hybrid sensor histidine kinase/response regulator [Caldimonas sp.]